MQRARPQTGRTPLASTTTCSLSGIIGRLRPQVYRLAAAALAALLLPGCVKPWPNRTGIATQNIAPGVVLHRIAERADLLPPACEVSVLEVDLTRSGLRPEVVAAPGSKVGGNTVSAALTVEDWCRRRHAVAGINGGYFGRTVGGGKEVVGLLATGGMVRSSGRIVRARASRARFVRSVFWVDRDAMPHIGWATGDRGRRALLTVYDGPITPARVHYAAARSAVACGPTIVLGGAAFVTDREERLVSAARVPRTFIALGGNHGQVTRALLCVATAMTYRDAAEFVLRFFQQEGRGACSAAMCLDGGSSSQMAVLADGRWWGVPPSDVTVPSAIVVAPPR